MPQPTVLEEYLVKQDPRRFDHQLSAGPLHPLEESKSFDAHGQPPHDATYECFFEEGREPCAHDGDLFHALQFRSYSSDAARDACNGSWRHIKALGNV
jgi:hypothetical protein